MGPPVTVSRVAGELALARDLRELIEAIDRRLPQIARAGEAAIADEAKSLRQRASERLAELVPPLP
jgi:hypothetical protein